ncbi:hypothetical protein AURDEDRAFT_189111 [Auricularia subglabra TFB-10046 SS5]|uniref:Uncharacterized protein n=1 Tax=Auricularia subglabra (strain TFB-10046 / SS5) TaxID=717982 RepID=J0WKT1_AURST|nr:hypothetical protein AURDEDRAFT_189111 [Auricularia subglabra TFB-10046 SS5]
MLLALVCVSEVVTVSGGTSPQFHRLPPPPLPCFRCCPLAAPVPPPPPVLAPALVRAVAEASALRNRLKRTFDGDCFVSDGQGGYMSTRTQGHVATPFVVDYVKLQELSTLRRVGEMATQTPAATSVQSQVVDTADQDTAGDCCTSDNGVTRSWRQQTATAPVTVQAPPRRKRAREEDFRGRVAVREQAQGANRTAAYENEGAAAVESAGRFANRSDETMALTSALPAAEPAQEAVPFAGPARWLCTRICAAPVTVVPSRCSRRIQELAEKRAAERAADAAAASPTHRGNRGRDNGTRNIHLSRCPNASRTCALL